ncbi:WGR domain-containing protein [Xanthomonas campestris pv. campestris]|uniref:WGR domain-containing protein n=1 Tax=Xanthomonas campestris TaxID=339 RepID=UPI002269F773|nr:WGR domain-containing protein [Xanthomonas campestris]MDO0790276.1 WGR domain-containing protein [Xanthomonas campestris pv. campestris]MDO0838648.1 WGR domain-containing protein [Xanthomonas campestris pv. campestris]MEA9697358.1 WGR domain-containing protein [Xanthomonas campestris pv. raphani]MEB1348873.1 WGR domain-containing protein [Xanthomonas campestris pv. campestris]WDK48432.1 WGR domain-containing protein [Xanthomonas campestris pv. campestris]
MHILLQHDPGGNEPLRYVQLTLQPDLFGGWELLRESGQIGGRTQLRRDQYLLQDEADRAFEKARDTQLKRGFHVITGGADAPR